MQIHSTSERFWSKVDMSGGPDACWPWTAGRVKDGYGHFSFEGKNIPSHRYAFFSHYGYWPMPIGRHTCDNPPCCNPRHIIPGTKLDNSRDRIDRGRMYIGNRGNRNLNEEKVLLIRSLVLHGRSHGEVADIFGVSKSCVTSIVYRKTWKNI